MKAIEILAESSLARLYSKIQNHSVGAITAFRGDFSTEVNKQRNRKLASYLGNRGYELTVIAGGYIENPGTPEEKEVSEETFFVVNPTKGDDNGKLESDLVDLGELYDQDSILSYRFGDKPTYIGTTHRESADPAFGQRYALTATEWGNPKGPYFSRVRGRKFAFKECRTWAAPLTNNGKTTRYISAQQVEKQLNELRSHR